jgi:hypothetical protein
VSETKQYPVVLVFHPWNPIFSALFFSTVDVVGLFAYLPTLFFVVCFMMQLDAKNIVCCPQLLLFEMFRCWDNAN